MLNWGNGIQAAAPTVADFGAIPAGLNPLIKQPTTSFMRFTWKLSMTNNSFRCKLCGFEAVGLNTVIGTHFDSSYSTCFLTF